MDEYMVVSFLLTFLSTSFFYLSATVVEQTPLGQSLIAHCAKSGRDSHHFICFLDDLTMHITTKRPGMRVAVTQAWWELLNCWCRTQKDLPQVVRTSARLNDALLVCGNDEHIESMRQAVAHIYKIFTTKIAGVSSRARTVLLTCVGLLTCLVAGLYWQQHKVKGVQGDQAPTRLPASSMIPVRRPWVCASPLTAVQREELDQQIATICAQSASPPEQVLPEIEDFSGSHAQKWFLESATSIAHLAWWLRLAHEREDDWFTRMLVCLCAKQARHMPELDADVLAQVRSQWKGRHFKSRYANVFTQRLIARCAVLLQAYQVHQQQKDALLLPEVKSDDVPPDDEAIREEVLSKMKRIANPYLPSYIKDFFAALPGRQHHQAACALADAVFLCYAQSEKSKDVRGALHRAASCLARMKKLHTYWYALLAAPINYECREGVV